MKRQLFTTVTIGAIGLLSILSTEQAQAQSATMANVQSSAYRTVDRDTAISSSVQLQVAPGRATTIAFQTDEVIAYVLLADPSRIVYTVNAELGSSQAKMLFLRRIEPLDFPGSTTAWVTNLSVQTIDSSGNLRLYNFDVEPVAESTYVGVNITPAIAGAQTVMVSDNRNATLRDIEEGLEIAIQRGYTIETDSIVVNVRQLLALARNSNVTLEEAATSTHVPLAVVSELARIAQDQRLLHPTMIPETVEPDTESPQTVNIDSQSVPTANH